MLIHSDVTEKIIAAYYHVYNTLGYGFLEKVYENALVIEAAQRGVAVRQQASPVKVYYEGQQVGEYFAGLLVEACAIRGIESGRGSGRRTPRPACSITLKPQT